MALAPAFLRYAPEDDQRPDPLSDAVLDRACNARLDEIKAWLKPRMPALSDLEIIFALKAAIKAAGPDGFRATNTLFKIFNWPADMDLCCLVRDTCNALAFALRVETRVWAVRVGLRFPGRSEHKIEWMEETGVRLAGKVISVDDTFAAAICQPLLDGTVRAGPPRRVFAEYVVANTTLGEYAGMSTEPGPRLTLITAEIEAALMAPADPPLESRFPEDCPHCDGEGLIPLPGQDMLGEDCEFCDGTGKRDI